MLGQLKPYPPNPDLKGGPPMKLIAFANAILLGLVLTPFAHAQSISGFKANVPFEFRIGNIIHTAGEYSVVGTSVGSNVLLMQNLDRKPGTPMLLSPVQAKSNADSKKAKLVFHRYGR